MQLWSPAWRCVSKSHSIAGIPRSLTSCSRNLQTSQSLTAHKDRPKGRQRLFLAGLNPFLPPTARYASSPSFREIPVHEWLASLGLDTSSADEVEITHIAAGHGHALIAYRYQGSEAVFAIGRNESGQLGIGYNSQEPTRGLMEGFTGDYIEDIACGITSSYIQVRQGDVSALYTCGNKYRGQLGLPILRSSLATPSQDLAARATLVQDASGIRGLAVGYESAIIVRDDSTVAGTGVNTDGQLGTGDDVDRMKLESISLPDTAVKAIRAGADTSAIVTESGQLWTFGNSEYGQACHGEKIDRVMTPKMVDQDFFGGAAVADFCSAGSASIVLTEDGNVYVAGYGALGLGQEAIECVRPTYIPQLSNIVRIFGGYGGFAAVDRQGKTFSWGLSSKHGRLGTGSIVNVLTPVESAFRGIGGPKTIDKVAFSANSLFVLLRQHD